MGKLINFSLFTMDILKGRILNRNIPLVIGLHITNKCNFNCIYCYGLYYDNKKRDFETKDVLKLIDELHGMGTRYITLTGGEPLLRNDIDEIIRYIRKKKIICSMNTNASLIRKRIDVIRKLDSITVSLDGAERDTNDKNRGENSFDKIIDGINCLKENNIPFDTVTVLTRNNVSGIKGILDLAKEMDFLTEFNLVQDQNSQNQYIVDYQLTTEEAKNALRQLIQFKRRGYPILYANSSREYALNWPFDYNHKILYREISQNFKYLPCYMGRFMCHIDADGYVYPCIQLAGRFPALNFIEVGFKKAWDNLVRNKRCKACYAVCYNEFNQVYGLKRDVWWNHIKNLIARKI